MYGKRKRMDRRSSRQNFRRGARNVHSKNLMSSSGSGYVMRGGIRL